MMFLMLWKEKNQTPTYWKLVTKETDKAYEGPGSVRAKDREDAVRKIFRKLRNIPPVLDKQQIFQEESLRKTNSETIQKYELTEEENTKIGAVLL